MRNLFSAAAVLIALAAPMSASAQTAVADPASCAAVVAKAQDNIFLRIQQFHGQGSRESIKAMLQAAANAAAAGDDAKCWVYVKRSRTY